MARQGASGGLVWGRASPPVQSIQSDRSSEALRYRARSHHAVGRTSEPASQAPKYWASAPDVISRAFSTVAGGLVSPGRWYHAPMRRALALVLPLALAATMFAKDHAPTPLPDQLIIARHTFFDNGPLIVYEVLFVRSAPDGTSIERITLQPGHSVCYDPAKAEVATAQTTESLAGLLENKNPCAIPEKQLNHELQRRKHGLVFSSIEVSLRIQCGAQTRTLQADILDRDLFDPSANTPENTSWVMRTLTRIDSHLGKGVLDKPMFDFSEPQAAPPPTSPDAAAVAAGKYDDLFPNVDPSFRLSALYRAAQQVTPTPSIKLVSGNVPPDVIAAMKYPPIARAARIEGHVSFTVTPDSSGKVIAFKLVNGHPILAKTTEAQVAQWRLPTSAAGQTLPITLEFKLNCIAPAK